MQAEASRFLSSLSSTREIFVYPTFLKKSHGANWMSKAREAINQAEVVIVFDVEACAQSENAIWEIDFAKEIGKNIIELSRENIDECEIINLQSAYNFQIEFECCFDGGLEYGTSSQVLELYKIMVNSSEQLIQRRQITNGFFITIIGAIIGASGFIIKEKIITDSTALVLVLPIVIGLLMCRSWSNLVDNYGKLNAGKFRVIHALERKMEARIFEAEWVALGKGLRKEKYQSFTSTERNVPTLFSLLLCAALVLVLFSADWQHFVNLLDSFWQSTRSAIESLSTKVWRAP
ncbi:hypothetical protein JQT66_09320 [Sulfitobacter mediterraneus]|uniref:RipA family octameric membrane protein n=1 Tax=Sulfitobacter mediterraneus TaxID=83219 RepID=UPI0019328B14|nr:hypothetical protein [Sulfitobacter mediterraneus]MBM1310364.1 hypothetical protein [Sulfitobacter mediterraneus]MBM1314248.1 hypothetical protein [Sulfitobacter mediterraneus]MBM1322608.1 hypothetical protein [Sulfitobacter mediterraneus]MBM1326520.1 hypothetical protein [Sulfitobacter mediterraneus]MBM1397866.1 hypothetical protein [Sulfitobacter mediterraneus]